MLLKRMQLIQAICRRRRASVPEPHTQMLTWLIPFAWPLTSVATALIYFRGWLSARRAFPHLISGWRLSAFATGLFLVWIVIGSPVAPLDHRSLTIHMVKHLVLMTIAAPLILEGAPVFTLACGLPKLFIKDYSPLALLPARWLERYPQFTVLCWVAGTASIVGWHLPVIFRLGMRSHRIHILEDVSFLAAGLVFWWPIMQSPATAPRSPQWSAALYLFLATLPCDILSAFLVFCNRLAYPLYLRTPRLLRMTPLQDQECAGALMWVWVTFAYLIPAVAITLRLLSPTDAQLQRPIRVVASGVAGQSPHDAEAEVR
jgi:putative membrane protein